MPELPDVEIYRRRLARSGLHREIAQVRVRDTRLLHDVGPPRLRRELRGRELVATHRHGKHLVADLSSDGGVLVLHFGMTGDLLVDGEGDEPRHTRLLLELGDGGRVALVDQRRLGRVALARSLAAYVERERLGPDALSLDVPALRDLLRRSRGGIKSTLLDQERIAGLGNVYTDEVLFQAWIDPRARASALDDAAYRRLHRQLRRVVDLAVARGADPDRLPRTWLLPHRDDGAPCPRGKGTVRRFSSGGRAGYWCPACQRG